MGTIFRNPATETLEGVPCPCVFLGFVQHTGIQWWALDEILGFLPLVSTKKARVQTQHWLASSKHNDEVRKQRLRVMPQDTLPEDNALPSCRHSHCNLKKCARLQLCLLQRQTCVYVYGTLHFTISAYTSAMLSPNPSPIIVLQCTLFWPSFRLTSKLPICPSTTNRAISSPLLRISQPHHLVCSPLRCLTCKPYRRPHRITRTTAHHSLYRSCNS